MLIWIQKKKTLEEFKLYIDKIYVACNEQQKNFRIISLELNKLYQEKYQTYYKYPWSSMFIMEFNIFCIHGFQNTGFWVSCQSLVDDTRTTSGLAQFMYQYDNPEGLVFLEKIRFMVI